MAAPEPAVEALAPAPESVHESTQLPGSDGATPPAAADAAAEGDDKQKATRSDAGMVRILVSYADPSLGTEAENVGDGFVDRVRASTAAWRLLHGL
eukprot:21365-Chlamydomonas_euryale.AAC.1